MHKKYTWLVLVYKSTVIHLHHCPPAEAKKSLLDHYSPALYLQVMTPQAAEQINYIKICNRDWSCCTGKKLRG
jgi:hypothetical protein